MRTLGYDVNRVVRSDYLDVYKRVADGSTTMMFESWDLQMKDKWEILPDAEKANVERDGIGMVGL